MLTKKNASAPHNLDLGCLNKPNHYHFTNGINCRINYFILTIKKIIGFENTIPSIQFIFFLFGKCSQYIGDYVITLVNLANRMVIMYNSNFISLEQ